MSGLITNSYPIELQVRLLHQAAHLRRYVEERIPENLRPKFGADDVLQETWIAAFRNIESFRPDGPESFDRWLNRIARNKLIDCIKRASRLKRGRLFRANEPRCRQSSYLDLWASIAGEERTPSSLNAAREAQVAMTMAIASLPDVQRQAITLFHIEGRSQQETAKILEKSHEAVHGILYRARLTLRERVGTANRFFSDNADSGQP